MKIKNDSNEIPWFKQYWINNDMNDIQGFPCFASLYFKNVFEGKEDNEDPNMIIKNHVISIYPDNIPIEIQQSFVGIIISFLTFSKLNLHKIPSSFSWSNSEICTKVQILNSGNFIIFLLKMPNYFQSKAVETALNNTLKIFELFEPNLLNGKLTDEMIMEYIKNCILSRSFILEKYTFDVGNQMDFHFAVRPIDLFGDPSIITTTTQLFEIIKNISNDILSVALFQKNNLIMSSFENWLTPVLLVFNNHFKFLDIVDKAKFINLYNRNYDNNEITKLKLFIIEYNDLTFFFMIKDNSNNVMNISSEIKSIISNRIESFESEVSSSIGKNEKRNNVIGIWEDNHIVLYGECNSNSLTEISKLYFDFQNNPKLVVAISNTLESQVCGINFLDFEAFAETNSKYPWNSTLSKQYENIRSAFPNLPDEFTCI